MEIQIEEIKEIKTICKIKEFCCSAMQDLYDNFHILHFDINTGNMILTVHNEASYTFKEEMSILRQKN